MASNAGLNWGSPWLADVSTNPATGTTGKRISGPVSPQFTLRRRKLARDSTGQLKLPQEGTLY